MSDTMTIRRRLGRSGIEVSALGLGCWAIGGPFWNGETALGWGEVDDQESVRAIHAALDSGITFFDTADVYGTGHSERVLGRALAGRRGDVVVATKFGSSFDESTRQYQGRMTEADPAFVRRACEASLRRLGTDAIDLYQFHTGDFPPQRADVVRDVLEQLVEEGKIRAYGWSTDDPAGVRVFAQGPHCSAIQIELNVLDDAPSLLAVCDELDQAAVCRSPLAMGLLSGKFDAGTRLPADDVRGNPLEWHKWFVGGRPAPAYLSRLHAVREILTSGGRTLAQGALAWIWARSERTIPIPGFRTVAQVEENAAALALGPLAPSQMAEIEALLERS
jgi:aryl-alcohol dehydrogenase-like predicted oxidoreductase